MLVQTKINPIRWNQQSEESCWVEENPLPLEKKKKRQQDKSTLQGGLRVPGGNGINSDICA